MNMYQVKMNTRTKLFESMNWFNNGIETTPRNVITRTKIFESKWVVHQEIVWSTHNIDTGMKENLTKLKEKSPCMQGEISRNMNTHQVHKYWIKGNYDEYTSINMKTVSIK